MPARTRKRAIDASLVKVLEGFWFDWTIRAAPGSGVFVEGGSPGILIEKQARDWPVVIETEVGDHRRAEAAARSRLSNYLVGDDTPICAAIALVYPASARAHRGRALRDELASGGLEYALLTQERPRSVPRLPVQGWLQGKAHDLAWLIRESAVPARRAGALTDELELSIDSAEGLLAQAYPYGSSRRLEFAGMMGQKPSDEDSIRIRRMAMAIVVAALIFHDRLSGTDIYLATRPRRLVKTIPHFRSLKSFNPAHIVDEWQRILKVNDWPVFHAASRVIGSLPGWLASSILDVLWEVSYNLIASEPAKSHELTHIVFQRLVADREFLGDCGTYLQFSPE